MNSIRLRLLKWLLGPILLINLAAATLTYLLAWTPAQLAFDQSLADAVSLLAARVRVQHGVVRIDMAQGGTPVQRPDGVDTSWFAVRAADGRLLAGAADFPVVAPRAGSGIATSDAVMRGEPVRVASLAQAGPYGPLQVGVATTQRKRLQIRAATARSLILVHVLVSLALAAMVWLSVTNGLAPLARLRAALDQRGSNDLKPLGDTVAPYELAPLVSAFNSMLGRIADDARAQDAFRANVAHQLRTPLAGMKLQLEWLAARHAGDPGTLHSLHLLRQSNERMIRQTNQLLALARAEPGRPEGMRRERLDLARLVEESVGAFVDQAAAKDIDLGFELASAPLEGDRFLLRDLIDNLIDNAVRYTGMHGTVTVRCRRVSGGTLFEVEDSGPGIAPAQRAMVFRRHVRLDQNTVGNGLGLAIVRDIAAAHGADISVSDARAGSGALFRVRFRC
jgi:two-component system sensor histidine kinase TctE